MRWSRVRLANIALIVMGQSPPGETYNDSSEGLPFFQGKADFGDQYPTPRKWCSAPNRIAEPRDILLSVRAPVGPVNVAREKSCIGRGLAAIRANPTYAEQAYLHFFFKRMEPVLSLQGQGSTFAAIKRSEIAELQVPLPSLLEQRRIVEILDQADRLLRLRTEADAKADRILPALFVKMFGAPATNPMRWPVKRFDKICESRLGKMLDQKQQTGRHARPYLRNANVYWDRLDLQEVLKMDFDESDREEFRLRKGDVLICEGGEVGRSAIWNDELPECYFQKALHRVRPYPGIATAEFIVYLLWGLAQRGALQDTVSKVTFSHLTGVKLKALRIPVPPFALQEKFAMHVRATKRTLNQIDLARNRIGSLFDSLLHRAFSAELTASWCEAHMKELVQEIGQQAKLLS